MPRLLSLAGIGLVAGLLSALFGVGGGVIVVPALVAFQRFPLKQATATSLFAIGFTAVFGGIRYGLSGDVHFVDAMLIGIPAMLGVTFGTTLQKRISTRVLHLGFAVVAAATGLKLLTGVGGFESSSSSITVEHLLLVGALGILAGILSGLFGVGGGIIFVPALTLGVGLAQLQAEATSLVAMIPVVALGAYRQWRQGLVHVDVSLTVGLISVPGVLVGAAIATSLTDGTLTKAFGVFMLFVAAQMGLRGLRHTPNPAPLPATGAPLP
jgi:uncharacterized membrane protein YfcA